MAGEGIASEGIASEYSLELIAPAITSSPSRTDIAARLPTSHASISEFPDLPRIAIYCLPLKGSNNHNGR